jgi:hypothetical protein
MQNGQPIIVCTPGNLASADARLNAQFVRKLPKQSWIFSSPYYHPKFNPSPQMKGVAVTMANPKTQSESVDLGALQRAYLAASREEAKARQAFNRASEALDKANAAKIAAKQALGDGYITVRG